MPSTEFLLFLVIAAIVTYFIINYVKNNTHESEIQYRYIPIDNNYDFKPNSRSKMQIRDNFESDFDHEELYSKDHYPNQRSKNKKSVRLATKQESRESRESREREPMDRESINQKLGMIPMVSNPVGSIGLEMSIDPLRKFDYDTMNDDFTPPFRRSYYDDYNYVLHPGLHPLYTRGPPGRFRKIGTLIAQGISSDNKYKFLNLMGRQKYPGRDYEYYVTSTNTEQKIKFYIDTRGKEINDKDIVTIAELEGHVYKFNEDPDLSPKYDPYIL